MADKHTNDNLPPMEIVEAEEDAQPEDAQPEDTSEEPEVPDPAALGLVLPEDPQEGVNMLLGEVQDARAEASSYLDDLRRVAADFDNFRKRAAREQQATIDRASERVLKQMLPILDSFDAALAIEPQTETEEKLLSGMRGTYNQLMDVLRKEGLEVIPTWDEPFDPEVHEAVTSPTEGKGRLIVSQELRRGYTLKGRVLRPALVALDYEESNDQAAEPGDGPDEA